MDIYTHDEPAPVCGNCRITRTEDEVVSYMNQRYSFSTKRPNRQRKLDEYKSVNWAWIEEVKDDTNNG